MASPLGVWAFVGGTISPHFVQAFAVQDVLTEWPALFCSTVPQNLHRISFVQLVPFSGTQAMETLDCTERLPQDSVSVRLPQVPAYRDAPTLEAEVVTVNPPSDFQVSPGDAAYSGRMPLLAAALRFTAITLAVSPASIAIALFGVKISPAFTR